MDINEIKNSQPLVEISEKAKKISRTILNL